MGEPTLHPQIVIPGWTAGGVRALWVSEHSSRRMHNALSYQGVFIDLQMKFFEI